MCIQGDCKDVCKLYNPCDPNANCTTTEARRMHCSCPAGYSGNGLLCTKGWLESLVYFLQEG